MSKDKEYADKCQHRCECKHERVKFCPECRVVYCLDCKQEWVASYPVRPTILQALGANELRPGHPWVNWEVPMSDQSWQNRGQAVSGVLNAMLDANVPCSHT